MKTNKTPIQELIEFFIKNTFNCTLEDGTQMLALDYDELRETFDSLIEKEKKFAFDCFEAGGEYQEAKFGYDYVERGITHDADDFEQFYSQYVERKSK